MGVRARPGPRLDGRALSRSALAAGAAALAASLGVPSAALSTRGQTATDIVYQVSISVSPPGGSEQSTEWVAPSFGSWRRETGDEIAVYTRVAGASSEPPRFHYTVGSHALGFSSRTGNARFMGVLADGSLTLDALRAYAAGRAAEAGIEVTTTQDGRTQLRFRKSGRDVTAVISEQHEIANPTGDVFDLPDDEVVSMDTQLKPGHASGLGLRAYWLGRAVSGRTAAIAVDHLDRRAGSSTHFTLYELPSARGQSSATPGQKRPRGEIQVASEPRTSTLTQRRIAALNGRNGDRRYKPWPRTTQRLRSGEQVTVVRDRSEGATGARPFYVLTKHTLVFVGAASTASETAKLVRQLTPLR